MARVIKSGTACYAKGGAVIGKTSEFMKTPNEFSEADDGSTDEVWGKGGDGQAKGPANPKPRNKQGPKV